MPLHQQPQSSDALPQEALDAGTRLEESLAADQLQRRQLLAKWEGRLATRDRRARWLAHRFRWLCGLFAMLYASFNLALFLSPIDDPSGELRSIKFGLGALAALFGALWLAVLGLLHAGQAVLICLAGREGIRIPALPSDPRFRLGRKSRRTFRRERHRHSRRRRSG